MNNQSFIDSTLNVIQAEYEKQIQLLTHRITICAGTGCVANGSLKVFDAFRTQLNQRQLLVSLILKDEQRSTYLSKSGCQGFCQIGPLITIDPGNIFYTAVSENDVDEIIEKTILKGEFVDRLLYKDAFTGQRCTCAHDITFYKKQQRFVLEKCGKINPDDIREYIYHEGYRAAAKACQELSDIEICSFILESGLRGRGGGGFPTGLKWELTRKQVSDNKFIICNGDEGDPGAFMDRSVMEGNPHGVIEGIIIASKAIGAQEGYVYVRAEYPLAVRRMKKAVEDARKLGILGQHILGSDHSFDLIVMEGAGAFVCGEETALIASIEGERGIPRMRPPYPAVKGLWEKPTLVNNTETFSLISWIIRNGAAEFSKNGTQGSKGTKVFALAGKVNRGGHQRGEGHHRHR